MGGQGDQRRPIGSDGSLAQRPNGPASDWRHRLAAFRAHNVSYADVMTRLGLTAHARPPASELRETSLGCNLDNLCVTKGGAYFILGEDQIEGFLRMGHGDWTEEASMFAGS